MMYFATGAKLVNTTVVVCLEFTEHKFCVEEESDAVHKQSSQTTREKL
jgi:hypothetical protein